jgi:integrase
VHFPVDEISLSRRQFRLAHQREQSDRDSPLGCSIRTDRHGYLAFRLVFDGLESHEGTGLEDTSENRRKAEDRARVIAQEIDDGTFDYLRWFPDGNLASRFRPEAQAWATPRITVRAFFDSWAKGDALGRPVTTKWRTNRLSLIRTHVLPQLGDLHIDQIAPRHITELQLRLRKRALAPGTIDAVIQSALRGMLRDAELAGYRTPEIRKLYDTRFIVRQDRGRETSEIDPFTDEERDRIIDWFLRNRSHYHAFVYFRFWTGTRPSEAIGLRRVDVDLIARRIWIRRSRVCRHDGPPKTGKSKRDVVIHDQLVAILRSRMPLHAAPDAFVFTTVKGAAIEESTFVRREWLPALAALDIRPRPFYNTRHTYISSLLAAGAKPLFVCRQTGTSLEMIERHYGDARVSADQLNQLLGQEAR